MKKKNKPFKVSVERKLYVTGYVKVRAPDAAGALAFVNHQIDRGVIQTTDAEWDEPEYEDHSFITTGDVE